MTHRVYLEELDVEFPCRSEQSVLECMVGAGKKGIVVGCRGGGCGVCKVEVLEGEYSDRPMSKAHIGDDDLSQKRVLACCISPRSNLSLRVIGKIAKPIQRRCQK